MRVTTKIVFDSNWNVLQHEWFEYDGPVALCKGDDLIHQQEKQQLDFNTKMMAIFQAQYKDQKNILDFLSSKLKPMIESPTGYSKEALTAMRTGATDQISTAYQNAQRTLQNNLNQRNGGSDLPSGSADQLQAALLQSEATDKANTQNTITLNDENLKNSNLWNAYNVLSGNVASQFNPVGYAGAYNQGSANVGELGTAYKNSKKGFWSNLAESFGSSLGQGLGSVASGGKSSLSSFFCWVAASLYGGWNAYKTRMCRFWMANIAPAWLRNFYQQHGEWIASTPLRYGFYPVFEFALRYS